MTKITASAAGGAMPRARHRAVMSRAWAIFHKTYCYPQIAFASIGRECFNACLRQAWAEAREAARIAAIPADVKATRIASLRRQIEFAGYSDNYRQARCDMTAAHAEISALT